MLTNNYNSERGWVNDESSTDTTSSGYSFGGSKQKNYNENLSYDKAIDQSAQNTFELSSGTSEGTSKTKTINFSIPDNKCYVLTALPVFYSEVIIWATGNIDQYNITHINYNKSVNPIELSHFSGTAVECDKYIAPKEKILNSDEANFTFIKKDNKNNSSNTLRSGDILIPNEYITTGRYSFGLTNRGELKICNSGKFEDDCKPLWTNGINNIPINTNHDLKFFIGDNGHLYITAKNIYKTINEQNVKYPTEYIKIVKDFIDDEKTDKSKIDVDKIKELISQYDDFNNHDLQKRFRVTSFTTSTKKSTSTTKFRPIISSSTSTKSTTSTTSTKNTSTTNSNTTTTTTITTTTNTNTTNTNNTNTNTSTTTTNSNTSTTTTNSNTSTTKTESNKSAQTTLPTYEKSKNDEYIIWDSLPKNLLFNVGYPDDTGYYLHIKDGETVFDGPTVTLYDGTGVKIWEITAGDDYKGYSYPKEYMYPLNFNTNLNEGLSLDQIDFSNLHTHTVIEPTVKDEYIESIEMKCGVSLDQNRALSSKKW